MATETDVAVLEGLLIPGLLLRSQHQVCLYAMNRSLQAEEGDPRNAMIILKHESAKGSGRFI